MNYATVGTYSSRGGTSSRLMLRTVSAGTVSTWPVPSRKKKAGVEPVGVGLDRLAIAVLEDDLELGSC